MGKPLMILYRIKSRGIGSNSIEYFFQELFHGVAWRPSKRQFGCHRLFGRMSEKDMAAEKDLPLQVVREGTVVPHIFRPGSWIVSQTAKDRLDGIANLVFGPVNFVRLFRYPWRTVEDALENDPRFEKFINGLHVKEDFFFSKRHDQQLCHHIEPYYELIGNPPRFVADAYPESRSLTYGICDDCLSPKMMEEHPLVVDEVLTMTEAVFDQLRDLFDFQFFTYTKFETDFETLIGECFKAEILEKV